MHAMRTSDAGMAVGRSRGNRYFRCIVRFL